MENLHAAHRLLSRSSRTRSLFHSRTNSLTNNFTQTPKLIKQDDRAVCRLVSNHFGFLRGFGDVTVPPLPRFEGYGSRTQCMKLTSAVSTPTRNQSFSFINCDDISYFKKILGEMGVIEDKEKLEDANTDWMKKYKGSSKLLLQPRST